VNDFLTLLLEPLRDLFDGFMRFAPNLLAMLTIFIGGIIVARIIRMALRKLLTAVKFDSWSDRMGFTVMMRKGDLWSRPSETVSQVVFWFLVIVTIMVGLNAVQVDAIDALVAQFFLYLPRIFSAILILVIGYIIAGFLSRTMLIALVNSGMRQARVLSESVRLLILVFILAMALEQLNLAPNIVVAAFSVMFGGIVIALAIAFGVGGIQAARRIIERSAEKAAPQDGGTPPERELEHL
jgi:hypothetical protein